MPAAIAPVFDPVINYGAIFSVIGSAVWALGLWYALNYRVKRLQEKNEEAHERAAQDRLDVKDKLAASERVLDSRLIKIEDKLDNHGTTLARIAVQDERMKSFDLRLADMNDQIKDLTIASRWPRPDRASRGSAE
jgi:hypothetical protein